MGESYYASAYKDLEELGAHSAAVQLLREGLAAHPASTTLLELARGEGLEVPLPGSAARPPPPAMAGVALPVEPSPLPSAAPPSTPTASPAAGAGVAADGWRPPPGANTGLERDGGSEAVRTFRVAQAQHAAFAEADASAWAAAVRAAGGAGAATEALVSEERRLRSATYAAVAPCHTTLQRLSLEMRRELMRPPSTPGLASRLQDSEEREGPEGALRAEAAFEGCRHWEGEAWGAEGPGAYLEMQKRWAESDAFHARARDLAQTGPGTVHEALAALARATEAAVASMPKGSARVLVLGGHGASPVAAARAGAAHVAVFEPRRFVAAAAREVLARNLAAEAAARCTVVYDGPPAPPSGGAWDLVVVDLWSGAGAFALGALEAFGAAARAAGPGRIRRAIPGRVSVEVTLADGRLKSVSGFDLSAMDARFRGVSTSPIRVAPPGATDGGDGIGGHPTALRPTPLTEPILAFDFDLSSAAGQASLAAPCTSPLTALTACVTGRATTAVIAVHLHLTATAGGGGGPPEATLRFGQWLHGGFSVREGEPVAGVTARFGRGHAWVDWDLSRAEEPPFGYMALSDWYFEMLRDGARHDLYEKAIQAEIRAARASIGGGEMAPCRVLDVGSGDGILSMMALRSGASSVVGVEFINSIARASEEIVQANRRTPDRPNGPLPPAEEAPLDVWCTDVRGVTRVPEAKKFDVLVSELMDASGLGENLIQLMRYARNELCRQGAPVIPARLRLLGVLCEVRLPRLADVDMDAFWPVWPPERNSETLWLGVDLDKGEGDFRVLTRPTEFMALELGKADVNDVPTRADLKFEGVESGRANFVVWWFETQLSTADPSVVLTNAPKCIDRRHAATCWGQAAAELPTEAPVSPGAAVSILMEVPYGDYALRFRAPDARPPAAFSAASAASAASPPRPPPGAAAYGEAFVEGFAAFVRSQREARDFGRKVDEARARAGSATARADLAAVASLQRCALGVAARPYLFGVEPSTAARHVHQMYAIGGEGRS